VVDRSIGSKFIAQPSAGNNKIAEKRVQIIIIFLQDPINSDSDE
jgi:hypothetical protein